MGTGSKGDEMTDQTIGSTSQPVAPRGFIPKGTARFLERSKQAVRQPSTSRRQFLRGAVSGLVLTGFARDLAGGLAAEQAGPGVPIIDTHQHLWDLSRFRLAWLQGAPHLKRSFLPADYRDATQGLNVVKAVYMEVDVVPEQQLDEANYVIELCEKGKTPTVAAVISGRPAATGFVDYIRRFRDSRYIKGVRQVLHGSQPRGYCLDPAFVRSIRLLGELRMSYDLCLRPAELADAVRLVEQCPDTRFILDHCGNADPKAFLPADDPRRARAHDPEQWRRDVAALAAKPNVVCKISGVIARAPKDSWKPDDLAPVIRHCLAEFGPDRVMFGGDWPVCLATATFRQWVEALTKIVADLNEADRRKLFHDNAARFYGLGNAG